MYIKRKKRLKIDRNKKSCHRLLLKVWNFFHKDTDKAKQLINVKYQMPFASFSYTVVLHSIHKNNHVL